MKIYFIKNNKNKSNTKSGVVLLAENFNKALLFLKKELNITITNKNANDFEINLLGIANYVNDEEKIILISKGVKE
jgi:hypothetical protein